MADSQKVNNSLPSLKELMTLPISEWYPLGIQLGLEDYRLRIIRNNNASLSDSCQQCTIDMFQKWLDSSPVTPSYEQLHEALVNCGMRTAANYLEKKRLVKPRAVVRPFVECEPTDPGTSGSHQPPHQTSPSCDKPTSSSDLEKLMFTPGAVGPEVVKACVKKIAESKILPDDNGFMRRIAYVMSKDGTDMKSDGGIWQVSDFAFHDTMDTGAHYRLPSKYYKIRQAFPGIDWPSTTRQDLDKPFFSALAARLYLSNLKERIPNANRIEEQASYWKAFYVRGAANEKKFVEAVAELKE